MVSNLSFTECQPYTGTPVIPFKVLPFCIHTPAPTFLPLMEALLELFLPDAFQDTHNFRLDVFSQVKIMSFHHELQLREQPEVRGCKAQ